MTVGAYEQGGFHVNVIADFYERGVKVDSQMLWGPLYCGEARLQGLVAEAVRWLLEEERARIQPPAGGGPERDAPSRRTTLAAVPGA